MGMRREAGGLVRQGARAKRYPHAIHPFVRQSLQSSYSPLLFPTNQLGWREIGKRRKGERELHFLAVMRIAHASESSPSTAFCPNISCHRLLLWLAKLIYNSPSNLKKQHHFLRLLGDSCFPRTLPAQEDSYSCALGIPPHLEKLLSPLGPSSSSRQLVSGTLDFFSYLLLLRDQLWSTGS